MKKIYFTLLLLASYVASYAQPFSGEVVVICNRLEQNNGMLELDLDIVVDGTAINKTHSWTIIPELLQPESGQAVLFPRVLVNGRNKRQMYDRMTRFESRRLIGKEPYQIVNVTGKSTAQTVRYTVSIPYQSWMDDSQLVVNQILGSCCDQEQLYVVDLARMVNSREVFEALVAQRIPEKEQVKQRSIQAEAYLDFQLDKSVILPDYRRNPQELDKIDRTLSEVRNNKDVNITSMHLTGYASPEGTYAHNEKLSRDRAEALARLIQDKYGIGRSMMTTSSVAEDWVGFRKAVEARQDVPNRSEVLSIIDSNEGYDARERRLRALAGGVPFRWVLNNIFPDLRRVEYKVDFDVRDYSVEESRNIFETDPRLLSYYELYLLGETYDKRSPEYARLERIVSERWSDDPAAKVNAASGMIARGEYDQAISYLRSLPQSPETLNNLGVAYLYKKDFETAGDYFRSAARMNSREGQANLERLNGRR